ncbi:MAG: TonB family protein [bacterium]
MEIEFKKIKADSKSQYGTNFKKSLILTLTFFIFLIYVSPRVNVVMEGNPTSNIMITFENIPITRQIARRPPPPKPTIPVPSDDESIPEDETIVETTLRYDTFFDQFPEGFSTIGSIPVTPPRPLAWVFPEYPEDEKKKGIKGVVKLSINIDEKGRVVEVIVLKNSTGSEKCAQAAIEAAYGSRFLPAREGNKPVSYWITQPYRFDLKK